MSKLTEKSILQEAEEIVNGARATDYGSAKESFTKIGQVTTLLLDRDELDLLASGIVSATTVCKMLQAVKLVRESNSPKRDNRVDLCGYTDLLDKLRSE